MPAAAGRGRAGETIGIIQDAFGRGRTPATLTANQRQRWADLRAHNAHDCAGMRELCVIATSEIDDRARRLAKAGRSIPGTQLQLEPIA